MDNLSHATTHDDVNKNSKTMKKKNISKTNRYKKLSKVDLNKLVLDRNTKEPVHRKAKVVIVKKHIPNTNRYKKLSKVDLD